MSNTSCRWVILLLVGECRIRTSEYGSLLGWADDVEDPFSSRIGIFSIASKINRKLPTATDNVTHEYIHSSVLKQTVQNPTLQEDIKKNPKLVPALLPLEEEVKALWPIPTPQKSESPQIQKPAQESTKNGDGKVMATMLDKPTTREPEDSKDLFQNNSFGKYLRELFTSDHASVTEQ